MKKVLAIALAALGITTAQAVTVNWTYSGDDVYSETKSKYIKDTNSFETGYSLAFVLTVNSLPAVDTKIMDILQWASGNSEVWLGNGKLKFQEKESGGSGSGEIDVAKGDTVLVALTWVYGENATANTFPTISHYANGTEVLSVTQTTKAPGVMFSTDGVQSNDAWTVSEITAYKGVLSAEEISSLTLNGTSDIRNVPEPTALALLALGVAGLALKRKVA